MRIAILAVSIAPLLAGLVSMSLPNDMSSGRRFVGFSEFKSFEKTPGEKAGETVLTSPEIDSGIAWNELVVSWNAEPSTSLRVEAKAAFPDHETKWYVMGLWSGDPTRAPRESLKGQKDTDGDVETDTLVLKRAGAKVRVRVLMLGSESGTGGERERVSGGLQFLGISFLDTKAVPAIAHPNKKAWGKELIVPEMS